MVQWTVVMPYLSDMLVGRHAVCALPLVSLPGLTATRASSDHRHHRPISPLVPDPEMSHVALTIRLTAIRREIGGLLAVAKYATVPVDLCKGSPKVHYVCILQVLLSGQVEQLSTVQRYLIERRAHRRSLGTGIVVSSL